MLRSEKNFAQAAAQFLKDYEIITNTGLRPDEARNLQQRDVAIVEDDATGETSLEIEVRGKRGVGYCNLMPGACGRMSGWLTAPSRCRLKVAGRSSAAVGKHYQTTPPNHPCSDMPNPLTPWSPQITSNSSMAFWTAQSSSVIAKRSHALRIVCVTRASVCE
jgi:hypothetical protein